MTHEGNQPSPRHPVETREQAPGPEDARAEYSAVVEYHNAIGSSRFTIAGLYVAAIGFVAGAVLGKDAAWITRVGGSLLAWWLTICLWIVELRTRCLYTNLAHRGIDIEHRRWGLIADQWYQGFFSRQYKEKPKDDDPDRGGVPPDPPGPDCPRILWMQKRLPSWVSGYVTHTLGLDLLYLGGFLFWTVVFCVSLLLFVRNDWRPL